MTVFHKGCIVRQEILPPLRSSEWHRLLSRTYVRDIMLAYLVGESSVLYTLEWHTFWQEILQGKSHVTIVWREILHFTTVSFRMTVKCHSEQMRESHKNRVRNHAPGLLLPLSIMSFRTETYGRVWGISSFLLETVAIVLSLGRRCFAIAQHDIRLGVRFFGAPHLRMTSKCHSERMWGNPRLLLMGDSSGSAPQNDIIQQRAITTNERFFLSTVVRMTVRLGWDSSLRLRSVQNDSNVISNVGERSHIICSLGGRCFAALSMDKHARNLLLLPLGVRFFISLRFIQNDRDVILCKDGRPERNPGKQKLLPSYGRSFKGNRRKGA